MWLSRIEKNYEGEVVFSPGYSVGYLEQDPQLDPEKTVRECVQEGVQPIMDMLAEYDAINMAFADPDADFDKLLARQAELQDKLDSVDAWNIDTRLAPGVMSSWLPNKITREQPARAKSTRKISAW